MADTVAALTLDLIRSGGPITTDDLQREVATLRNLGGAPSEYTASLVLDSLRFHLQRERIQESADGWEYVPTPLAAGRSALAPPKRRKSDDRQKSLFSLGGRD